MITLEEYKSGVLALNSDDEKGIFIQKHFLHGIPVVFDNRETDYYNFRKRISERFKISFFEVMIVGSSKFGFSPYKFSPFTYESDIDVLLFNERLFDYFHELISNYQYKIREGEIFLNSTQYTNYMKFLR